MRKYLYYIKDGNKEMEYPTGEIRVQEKQLGVNKGDEVELTQMDIKTGEKCKVTYVGLGYKDFDNEENFEENIEKIIEQRIDEIGLKE